MMDTVKTLLVVLLGGIIFVGGSSLAILVAEALA